MMFCQASVVFSAACKLWFAAFMFYANMTANKHSIGDVDKTIFDERRERAVVYDLENAP